MFEVFEKFGPMTLMLAVVLAAVGKAVFELFKKILDMIRDQQQQNGEMHKEHLNQFRAVISETNTIIANNTATIANNTAAVNDLKDKVRVETDVVREFGSGEGFSPMRKSGGHRVINRDNHP